jgi:TRAP-type C4-dicarboxylate transport system permease small subunit
MKLARNIAIIALVALAIVAVPGGGETAATVLAVISLAFLAAIVWFGWRLYRENQFTLTSLTDEHRALLYGAIALAFMALVATPELWTSGIGTLVWFAMLGAAVGALYYVWVESRRYRV